MANRVDDETARAGTGDGQLDTRATFVWYTVAAVTYIGASVVEKGLLNWFVGPLWLVAVVWAGPAIWDRLRRRTG